MNRRLHKLARWGDKPVDDRQPAEMRMMLRSGIQPQFRPSYGSVTNGSATSQLQIGTNSASMSSRSQSTHLPSQTSSSLSSTIAITPHVILQTLPAFSNLHEQSEIFGLNPSSSNTNSSSSKGTSSVAPINNAPAAPSSEACSTNGKVMSLDMMGTIVGGMSMGGISSTGGGKIDIEAIRALQMQSVKELSDALKGKDRLASTLPCSPSIEALDIRIAAAQEPTLSTDNREE